MVADASVRVKDPVHAVIFDYGGVLRGDGRALWNAADTAAGLTPGTLWAAWHDIPEYRRSREGAIDGTAFRAAVHRALAGITGTAQRANTALAALDAELARLPPVDPGMRALVERLRHDAKVKLGLLSNANRGWTERLRARGLAEVFDDIIVSADVGLAKPDPAIFLLAAERLGVAPSGCLMIDDQAQHVEGAQAAGMRAHHHEPGRLDDLVTRLRQEGALT